MAKRTARRAVERGEADSYAKVGEEFFHAGEIAFEYECWNAAGLLFVHGAIALPDAVAIRLKGEKSASENHMDAVALLREAAAEVGGRDEALGHLKKLIEEKSRAAYTGLSFRRRDVESLRKHVERLRAWARKVVG